LFLRVSHISQDLEIIGVFSRLYTLYNGKSITVLDKHCWDNVNALAGSGY